MHDNLTGASRLAVATRSTPAAAAPVGWRRWRYRLEAAAIALPVQVTPWLPWPVVRRLGRAIGWLGYRLLPHSRQIALANLDAAFGTTKTPCEKRRITCASFQSFGVTMLGLFWSVRLNPATLDQLVEVPADTLPLIDRCRARGKGVIFIMMHYGNWEVLGHTLALHKIPTTIVARKMRNPALERIFCRLRSHSGHRIVSGACAPGQVVRTLRHGGCVALLIDQHVGVRSGGTWCEFFGLPVLTCSTVGRLELLSGAALVACVAQPLADGRTRLNCQELPCAHSGNQRADVQTISQRCLEFCESIIRQQPEHWLWSYKRWRARPSLEQGRYPAYSHPRRPAPSHRLQTISQS